MPNQDLARTAFAAYTAAVGGTTHDNRPIPSWEHLGPTVQSGWVAAAAAVSAGVIPVAGQVAELVIGILRGYSGLQAGEVTDSCGAGQG